MSPCSGVRNGFGGVSSFLGLWTLGMEYVSPLLICPLQIFSIWVVMKLLIFFLKCFLVSLASQSLLLPLSVSQDNHILPGSDGALL